jgi:hypothetical protein
MAAQSSNSTSSQGGSFTPAKNAFAHVSFAGFVKPADEQQQQRAALPKTPAPPSFFGPRGTTTTTTTTLSGVMNSSSFAYSNGIPTPPPPRADRLSELESTFRTHVLTQLPVHGGDWISSMLDYKAYHDGIVADDANPTTNYETGATTTTTSAFSEKASNNNHDSTESVGSSTPSPPAAAAAAIGDASPAVSATSFSSATTQPSSSPPSTNSTEMTTTTSPANHNSVLATTSPTTTATNNNKNNNKFYETRAKCLKSLDGEWKANPSGTLSLECDASGKRIVIRYDATGKVTFNCRLPTEIAKVEQKNGKGQTKRFIQFLTKLEEKKDLVLVRLQTKEQELDALYEKIRELGDHMS